MERELTIKKLHKILSKSNSRMTIERVMGQNNLIWDRILKIEIKCSFFILSMCNRLGICSFFTVIFHSMTLWSAKKSCQFSKYVQWFQMDPECWTNVCNLLSMQIQGMRNSDSTDSTQTSQVIWLLKVRTVFTFSHMTSLVASELSQLSRSSTCLLP